MLIRSDKWTRTLTLTQFVYNEHNTSAVSNNGIFINAPQTETVKYTYTYHTQKAVML